MHYHDRITTQNLAEYGIHTLDQYMPTPAPKPTTPAPTPTPTPKPPSEASGEKKTAKATIENLLTIGGAATAQTRALHARLKKTKTPQEYAGMLGRSVGSLPSVLQPKIRVHLTKLTEAQSELDEATREHPL
tara:strand:+ start:783 stop:1178 length:396 start_codon:yes stop_codon:yes gene_type:complete